MNSLIQFVDKNGNVISDVVQTPNKISLEQLKSLVNTTQDLYFEGKQILNTLESVFTESQVRDQETIKKIRIGEYIPAAHPALYCSGTYSGHEGPVLVTKFGKDILVTCGGDRTVRFWDLITKTQFKIQKKHDHWVLCADINDSYVVSGGMDKNINLYDHQGNHIRKLARHKGGVVAVKFHQDKIVSISRDGSCIVWNMTGEIHKTWAHTKAIKALCVSGEYIITGGIDHKIFVYKDYEFNMELKGHMAQINCIEKHGNYIVSGDDSGTIIIWKDYKLHKRLCHKREVISVSIGPNGCYFASGSFDKTVKLWNIESGELLDNYYHVNHVYKVVVKQDLIISCSKDKTIRMFRISKKKCVSDLVCKDEIYDFDFNGTTLVCGVKNNEVCFYN